MGSDVTSEEVTDAESRFRWAGRRCSAAAFGSPPATSKLPVPTSQARSISRPMATRPIHAQGRKHRRELNQFFFNRLIVEDDNSITAELNEPFATLLALRSSTPPHDATRPRPPRDRPASLDVPQEQANPGSLPAAGV